ncbi:MAG: hypothetical protein ACK4K9_00910 [Bacteroidia bacterium]
MEKKLCEYCQTPISGRADKRFCDDACRSAFNNKLNHESNSLVKNIDNALKRNRRILKDLIPDDGKTKVSHKKLAELGFNFNYYTNIVTTQKGSTYYFCYEFGYLILDGNYYMLVKRNFD